jgi:hypothetical protein
MERPEFVTDEHLEFLNVLRKSNLCNMFEAPVHLRTVYGLSMRDAKAVFQYWAETMEREGR